ncbi:phosphatase PAP2 family protein [Rhizobium sp. KVB221]|uniref:Phosphatase PAP2 family protein n=1 Tax=Rhizobium setariae TaxID=2801340 RepID=A0A937CR91_9HYPH|nr:phosphatase PAP2 family protein [Rhizobium setariae]MBL0374122.1 phosphatase PAP2 family protein [Rhizobium setariae]
MTKSEHRPLPVLYPFAAIVVLVLFAFLFLDRQAAVMSGHWPGWLSGPSAAITDVGASWWILTLTTLVIFAAWAWKQFARSDFAGRMSTTIISMCFYVLISVGLAALIVNIIKRLIGRPRPFMADDHGIFSFNPLARNFDFESFPSGHATTNGAFFMALALLFPRFRWPLLVIGVCFALTRVFIGVHFPSDVTAGFGFGMWFAFAVAVWFSRYGIVFDKSLRLK